jgi:N-acetylmuramoyl-L-alanine amidase
MNIFGCRPLHVVARSIVSIVLMLMGATASAGLFPQCPPIQGSASCAVLITINKNGGLTVAVDPSVPPYDGEEDTLVGVINKSGATVFGIFLQGAGIFGFDGDGANGGDYAGPGTSFSVVDANSGTVNFTGGLDDGKSLWFSLEGPPSSIKLSHTITVDPGHGGTMCAAGGTAVGGDTGTTGPTYKDAEHVLALAIGLKLQAQLAANHDTVTMTRTGAVCPSLKERVEIANNANTNLFVSIHFNGVNDPKVNGTQVWYLDKKLSSSQLATFNADAISAVLGTANRGTKRSGQDGKNLYVVNNTRMSAVLLEVGFLTNIKGDEDIMHRASSPADTAAAVYNAIQRFLSQ